MTDAQLIHLADFTHAAIAADEPVLAFVMRRFSCSANAAKTQIVRAREEDPTLPPSPRRNRWSASASARRDEAPKTGTPATPRPVPSSLSIDAPRSADHAGEATSSRPSPDQEQPATVKTSGDGRRLPRREPAVQAKVNGVRDTPNTEEET